MSSVREESLLPVRAPRSSPLTHTVKSPQTPSRPCLVNTQVDSPWGLLDHLQGHVKAPEGTKMEHAMW